jgi:hypothetical protein
MLCASMEQLQERQDEYISRIKRMLKTAQFIMDRVEENIPFFPPDMGKHDKLQQTELFIKTLEAMKNSIDNAIAEARVMANGLEDSMVFDRGLNDYVSHDEAIWNGGCHE